MALSLRPRIFVSSTIYDFRDLRSALKFWLEELGYDVQMSDHADFDKPLDVNSYDACLRAIDASNYFVLFIGSRVGGLYSKPDKISITRMEYRHAYERFKEGKLTVVPFVRRELWDVREDRKALRDYLRGEFKRVKELSDAEVDAIAQHESKFATDTEAIFSFIDEVARVSEMRDAVKTGAGYPKGNWIHVFDSFEEVTQAMRLALRNPSNLRRRVIEAGLRHEVDRNLQNVIGDHPNQLGVDSVGALGVKRKIGSIADLLGNTVLSLGAVNALGIGLSLLRPGALETTLLDEAIRSGEFLDYDSRLGRLHVGPTQALLVNLRESVESHRRTGSDDEQRKKFVGTYGSTGDGSRSVTVKNIDLLPVLLAYDAYEHVARMLVAVYRMLAGETISMAPKPFPAYLAGIPLKDKSSLSVEHVEEWIKKSPDFT